jgi:hypothetical protein
MLTDIASRRDDSMRKLSVAYRQLMALRPVPHGMDPAEARRLYAEALAAFESASDELAELERDTDYVR